MCYTTKPDNLIPPTPWYYQQGTSLGKPFLDRKEIVASEAAMRPTIVLLGGTRLVDLWVPRGNFHVPCQLSLYH
jgi:hypothetical protein